MLWFKTKKDKIKDKPKEEESPLPTIEDTKKHHKLVIKFKNGETTGYEISRKDLTTVIESFKPFIKWYFGRPESKEYLFQHNAGFTLHRREDIATFSLYDRNKKE